MSVPDTYSKDTKIIWYRSLSVKAKSYNKLHSPVQPLSLDACNLYNIIITKSMVIWYQKYVLLRTLTEKKAIVLDPYTIIL